MGLVMLQNITHGYNVANTNNAISILQVRWIALAHIAASWFASPILSGIMSCSIFWLLKKSVLQSNKPFEQGLRILPVTYGLTVAINVMSIALDGPKCKYFSYIYI